MSAMAKMKQQQGVHRFQIRLHQDNPTHAAILRALQDVPPAHRRNAMIIWMHQGRQALAERPARPRPAPPVRMGDAAVHVGEAPATALELPPSPLTEADLAGFGGAAAGSSG